MKRLYQQPLTGLLLGWPKDNNILHGLFNSSDVVKEAGPAPGWQGIVLHSREPLANEFDSSTGDFSYPFLLRESGNHAMLVSVKSHLVNHLLKKVHPNDSYYAPKVQVNQLVIDLSKHQHSFYCLSRVYAHVDGYGKSLRSIALFGDDLSDSALFQDTIEQLSSYRVELRDIEKGINILSISSQGEIYFYFNGKRSLDAVVKVLKYLTDNKYIIWPT